jgi:hypothetical protein
VSSIQSMSFGKGLNGSHSSASVQDLLSIQPSLVIANRQTGGSNKGGSRHSLANFVNTSQAGAGPPAAGLMASIASGEEAAGGLEEPLIRPQPQGFSTSGFMTTVLSLSEIASITRVSTDLLQHAKWRTMTTEVMTVLSPRSMFSRLMVVHRSGESEHLTSLYVTSCSGVVAQLPVFDGQVFRRLVRSSQ